MHTVNLYFVASPLQYLAAKAISEKFEPADRHILLWYKPGVEPVVKTSDWDACDYLPWPRFEPMPGFLGGIRRAKANIKMVADMVGQCDRLIIHSAVFDTEAINYFLTGLFVPCGKPQVAARILPDGVCSLRRYPLNPIKRALQYTRKARLLAGLNYTCFGGDRIGSDAPFCDRIYIAPGLPHEYPSEKVKVLPSLFGKGEIRRTGRALVIGQPLVEAKLLSRRDCDAVAKEVDAWLLENGFAQVDYKAHPKDPAKELLHNRYQELKIDEPLETWMSKTGYDVVIGVRSSSLLFARQIYPAETKVLSFGWDRISFKSKKEKLDHTDTFLQMGVRFVGLTDEDSLESRPLKEAAACSM